MLTQERLKELFTYDMVTGNFIRNTRICNRPEGEVAGCVTTYGYIAMAIDNKHYQAHKLAFLYMEGYLPETDIDHIDGDKSNNRYANLRICTRAENMQNIKKAFKSKKYSKLLGAYYDKAAGNWKAGICINYKTKWLGRFDTDIEAHEAYMKAKQELHPFSVPLENIHA